MTDKDTAIWQMNELGSRKTPFLFIIDFKMSECQVIEAEKIDSTEILYCFNGIQNYKSSAIYPEKIVFKKNPEPFSDYLQKFNRVMQEIQSGNTYLLNLTCQTPIETNLTLKEIFLLSKAKYKLWYQGVFTFFSPETFIRITGNTIYSCPMKGTIDATIENAKEIILKDPKEQAEHNTIIDLIRNDLSMVANNVRVEKYRYIEEVLTNQKNLLQVSSLISGELQDDCSSRLGDIIFTLLPAGSVTGAPKKKTVEIIRDTEKYDRGFYTGIAGYFDGSNLDTTVIIRFIEKKEKGLFFKSGGGVTSLSDPKKEFKEMIDKIYVPFN
jgi:para-aminobenzoate synthetase component I